MNYKFFIEEFYDRDWQIDFQKIRNEEGKRLFSVHNLSECPEDATIERSLFSAGDYIDAVRFGIELAKKGYEDIEVIEVDN